MTALAGSTVHRIDDGGTFAGPDGWGPGWVHRNGPPCYYP